MEVTEGVGGFYSSPMIKQDMEGEQPAAKMLKLCSSAQENVKKTSGFPLLVSGLRQGTKAMEVKALFAQYGKVLSSKIVGNPKDKSASLFAQVTMDKLEECNLCISRLHSSLFNGITIKVKKIKTKSKNRIEKVEHIAHGKEVKPTSASNTQYEQPTSSTQDSTPAHADPSVLEKEELNMMHQSGNRAHQQLVGSKMESDSSANSMPAKSADNETHGSLDQESAVDINVEPPKILLTQKGVVMITKHPSLSSRAAKTAVVNPLPVADDPSTKHLSDTQKRMMSNVCNMAQAVKDMLKSRKQGNDDEVEQGPNMSLSEKTDKNNPPLSKSTPVAMVTTSISSVNSTVSTAVLSTIQSSANVVSVSSSQDNQTSWQYWNGAYYSYGSQGYSQVWPSNASNAVTSTNSLSGTSSSQGYSNPGQYWNSGNYSYGTYPQNNNWYNWNQTPNNYWGTQTGPMPGGYFQPETVPNNPTGYFGPGPYMSQGPYFGPNNPSGPPGPNMFPNGPRGQSMPYNMPPRGPPGPNMFPRGPPGPNMFPSGPPGPNMFPSGPPGPNMPNNMLSRGPPGPNMFPPRLPPRGPPGSNMFPYGPRGPNVPYGMPPRAPPGPHRFPNGHLGQNMPNYMPHGGPPRPNMIPDGAPGLNIPPSGQRRQNMPNGIPTSGPRPLMSPYGPQVKPGKPKPLLQKHKLPGFIIKKKLLERVRKSKANLMIKNVANSSKLSDEIIKESIKTNVPPSSKPETERIVRKKVKPIKRNVPPREQPNPMFLDNRKRNNVFQKPKPNSKSVMTPDVIPPLLASSQAGVSSPPKCPSPQLSSSVDPTPQLDSEVNSIPPKCPSLQLSSSVDPTPQLDSEVNSIPEPDPTNL